MLNDSREIVSELRHSIDPPHPQDGHPVTVEISAETNEVCTFNKRCGCDLERHVPNSGTLNCLCI